MHVTLEVITLLKSLLFWCLLITLLFHKLLSDQHIFIALPKMSNQLWQLKHFFLLLCAWNLSKYALLLSHGNDLYKLKIPIFFFNDNWASLKKNIYTKF